jgi:hypothetical protein
VFFVMMLFGIMALAALVIDIGFARLTQRQMKIAADSAAVEGLRGEGDVAYADRRDAARDFVHWHFDDDLDATGTYPLNDDGAFDSGSGQFGAGPLVQFSGGVGDPSLVAGQLMEVDPDNSVYKPVVVNGTSSASGGFEVTLRRGAIDPPNADLYANGPSVPYLFARGSLINRQLITDGITVRATSIASVQPARSIGTTYRGSSDPEVLDSPGMISIAIRASQWMNMSGILTLNINAADRSQVDDSSLGNVGFVSEPNAVSTATSVGSQPSPQVATAGFVSSLVSGAAEINGSRRGYLLIVGDATIPPGGHVIGFGFIDGIVQTAPDEFQVTKSTKYVAFENATAVPTEALPTNVAEEVIAAGVALGGHALLVPALER